jgi:hypothetical protein
MSCEPPLGAPTCECKHKIADTGGVFYQSSGWLECLNCGGWQRIKKAIYPAPDVAPKPK